MTIPHTLVTDALDQRKVLLEVSYLSFHLGERSLVNLSDLN